MTIPAPDSRTIAATALREEANLLRLLLDSPADDGRLGHHITRLLADADRLEAEGIVDG